MEFAYTQEVVFGIVKRWVLNTVKLAIDPSISSRIFST